MIARVVGLGAGGHARCMIEILQRQTEYDVVGLLTPNKELQSQQILGVPILGSDEMLPELLEKGIKYFFVGVGGVGDNRPRK